MRVYNNTKKYLLLLFEFMMWIGGCIYFIYVLVISFFMDNGSSLYVYYGRIIGISIATMFLLIGIYFGYYVFIEEKIPIKIIIARPYIIFIYLLGNDVIFNIEKDTIELVYENKRLRYIKSGKKKASIPQFGIWIIFEEEVKELLSEGGINE